MQCRQVLLEIRKKRDEELQEYQALCAKVGFPPGSEIRPGAQQPPVQLLTPGSMMAIENFVTKRRSILMLELPFQTDAVSVNEARVCSTIREEVGIGCTEKTLESWARSRFPNDDFDDMYKRNYWIGCFERIWPKFKETYTDQTGKEKLGKLQKVPFEDIGCSVPREVLYQGIACSSFSENAKKTWKSHARDLILYARNRKKQKNPKTICQKNVTLSALSKWFEYLEDRCLKSFSDKPYRDLAEIRLLFYIPLNIDELRKITIKNIGIIKNKNGLDVFMIKHEGETYHISLTFVNLVKSLYSKTEPLLRRNSRQLNDFIGKSTKAAKIEEKITPGRVQHSVTSIYRLEGYVERGLPPR